MPPSAPACGPSALQQFLGALTFAIGLYGSWLLYRAARLNAEASGLFENFPFGASNAFRSVVRARVAAERRRLTQISGDHTVAGTIVLFFALIAGLTINFPTWYAAAFAVAVVSVVVEIVLRRRAPEVDRRLGIFVRSQEVIAAANGVIIASVGDSTLDYVLRIKSEKLAMDEDTLKQQEQKYASELNELRQQIQEFNDKVRAHRSA